MKTTIYDLLGMIKDGKAPKKIMYDGLIFSFDNVDKDYYREEYGNLFEYLFNDMQTDAFLNDEVEILETTITYKQDDITTLDEFKQLSDKDKQEVLNIIKFKNELDKKVDKIEICRNEKTGTGYFIRPVFSEQDILEVNDVESEIIFKINEIIDYVEKE